MMRVTKSVRIFKVISFDHIHRELNSNTHILSKMGVGLELGQIYYEEYLEEEVLVS